MRLILNFTAINMALAVILFAQNPPSTLYNGGIYLSSIGNDYQIVNGNLVYNNTYTKDPSEAANKVGIIPTRVYRMYSGFQSSLNSISTTNSGNKAEATEFTITYSGPASNQTVNLKIGITPFASPDGGDAWNGVENYPISKSVSGSSQVSLTAAELNTVSGWLQNGSTIYFGAIMNNEQSDAAIFNITNVLIKYKRVYTINVTIDRDYDQRTPSGIVSLNGQTIIGTSGSKKFDEGTIVTANTLTLVTQNTTDKYVFNNMVLVGTGTYNTPTPAFPAIYSDKDLFVNYTAAVKSTLKTQVTYNSVTDADIPNAPMDVYKDGALYLSAITPVDKYVPKNASMSFETKYGAFGEDMNYQSSQAKVKHQTWNGGMSDFKLRSNALSAINDFNAFAKYNQLHPATLQISLDGILQTTSGVQFQDPWKVVSGSQPRAWDSYAIPFTPGAGSYAGYGGVFQSVNYNQTFPNNAHYRVKTDITKTIDGSISNFHLWQTSGAFANSSLALETPVRFDAANATVTAAYKGILRTGVPTLSDAKNQRRLIKTSNGYFIMVYESMGDIWLTTSTNPNATTWESEVRLNTNIGQGSNPTFSNAVGDKYLIAWIEWNGTTYDLHLQSMFISGAHNFGWTGLQDPNRIVSHRVLNNIPWQSNGSACNIYSRANARPVVQLSQDATSIKILYAMERAGSGICAGRIIVPILQGIVQDLNSATLETMVGPEGDRKLSTNTSDKCPVIVNLPSVYGYPAITRIYYLANSSGRRVAQYDYDSKQTALLSPTDDNDYYSLQGSISPSNHCFALSASALRGAVNVVNVYTKPTYYGTSQPSLSTVYNAFLQPSIMMENSSGYGSSPMNINMKATSGGTWYKADNYGSLTSIGSAATIAGMFLRENVTAGERYSMMVKHNVSPAKLELSNSNGQALSKSSGGTVITNSRIVFLSKNKKNPVGIVNISDADVTILDTVQIGNQVSLFVNNPSTMELSQDDSIKLPIGIDVKRNGKTIRSITPAVWNKISSKELIGLQAGDVVQCTLSENNNNVWWYREIAISEGALSKDGAKDGELLIPLNNDIAVYPNPFNPSTTFQINLHQSAKVQLSVYNMLGQEISIVVDGILPAGSNEFRFDGTSLTSGMYLYRLKIDKEIRSGRMMLLK